jgi:hypothetical protein
MRFRISNFLLVFHECISFPGVGRAQSLWRRAERPESGSRNGQEIFFTPQRPDWFWGPLGLLTNFEWGIFPGVKRPERKVDSPTSGAEVKNGGAIPPLPHMSWHSA